MSPSQHADQIEEIRSRYGNLPVRIFRRIYGASFAPHHDDLDPLRSILGKDELLVAFLKDHAMGLLDSRVAIAKDLLKHPTRYAPRLAAIV